MTKDFLFTSESVTEGHRTKIADQISDGVVDALIAKRPLRPRRRRDAGQDRPRHRRRRSHHTAWVDIPKMVRSTICHIGYTHSDMGYDGNTSASCVVAG